MCKFKPFNKHVLIEIFPPEKNPDLSSVLIPDGAKVGEQERYSLVKFICSAKDCDQALLNLNPDQAWWATHTGTRDDVFTTSARQSDNISLVVDDSMIEEVKINNKKFHIIHQNYIVGILDE